MTGATITVYSKPGNIAAVPRFRNNDPTAEEFESFQLNREKLVPPGKEVPLFPGPLDRGEYPFFGDFHQDTAKGMLVAK